MKQLLLILSIGLLGIGCSPERYSEDEVVTPGEYPNDTVTFLKEDTTPLNGIVYGEFGDMGAYKDGLKDGVHKEWHENGQLRGELNHKDGKPDGLWRSWYEDGQLRNEFNYKDGKRDGLSRGWHDNGQLRGELNHKDGELDGLWREWYENGQLELEETWKDGKPISRKEWDKDGNPK